MTEGPVSTRPKLGRWAWGLMGVVAVAFVAALAYSAGNTQPDRPAAPETDAAVAQADLRTRPWTALVVDASTGRPGGFGTVFLLSGTVHNAADFAVKDPTIRCTLFGASGTRVGRVVQTLHQVVPAQGSLPFTGLNMGKMGTAQMASFSCEAINAVAAN